MYQNRNVLFLHIQWIDRTTYINRNLCLFVVAVILESELVVYIISVAYSFTVMRVMLIKHVDKVHKMYLAHLESN